MIKFINELILYGFKQNVYLLIHFIGGFVYSMAHISFCKNFFNDQKIGLLYLIIFVCAIAWELYEYNKDDVVKIYGSKKIFIYDSIGDIISALIGALIISIL